MKYIPFLSAIHRFRAASIPVTRMYEMTSEQNGYPRLKMGNAAALTDNGDIVHPPICNLLRERVAPAQADPCISSSNPTKATGRSVPVRPFSQLSRILKGPAYLPQSLEWAKVEGRMISLMGSVCWQGVGPIGLGCLRTR